MEMLILSRERKCFVHKLLFVVYTGIFLHYFVVNHLLSYLPIQGKDVTYILTLLGIYIIVSLSLTSRV